MANKRIKDLGTTASTLAADDYVAIDGNANGTRKIVKGDLVNDISTQVAGTYLDEANNLSDVASKDTSKLNLEVPDVGSAANEVPLNGMLGSMAYQSADSVSVAELEVTDKVKGPLGIDGSPSGLSSVADDLVVGDGSGHRGITVYAGTSSEASVYFADGTSGADTYRGYINYQHTTNALRFGSNGSLRATIDSAGRLGVNNSSPGSYNSNADDLVVGDGVGNRGLSIATGDSSTGRIIFANASSPASIRGAISYVHGSEQMIFATNAGTQWTLNSSGDLVASTGNGIDFGSTNTNTGVTVSGSVMSEYEQGTFTPKLADAATGGNEATIGTVGADYIRVGNQVFFAMRLLNINTTGLTSGNAIYITDMPYECNSGSSFVPFSVMADTLTFGGQLVGIIQGGVSYANLRQFSSGTGDSAVPVSAISSGPTDLWLSGSYLVA
jgi:hypothetical protein